MKKLILIIFFILFWPIAFAGVEREEHIAAFDNVIKVNQDASLDISEKITIYDNGHHGRKAGYYTTQHTYHVQNAIRFLSIQDELNWNIPGQDHRLAILKLQTEIQLPVGAKILSYNSHVTQNDSSLAKAQQPKKNQLIITSDYLPPGKNLHITVSWQKGLVHLPTTKAIAPQAKKTMPEKKPLLSTQRILFVTNVIVGLLLSLFACVYLHRSSRTPRAIIPVFEPPHHLSPAAIRYIMRGRFDKKTLTAALVSMATKHFLMLQNDYGDHAITKIDDDDSLLTTDEAELAHVLFAFGNTTPITANPHRPLKLGRKRLKASLMESYQGLYFTRLFKIPTMEGRKLREQIHGFKLFLSTTDRRCLKSLNPPQLTPALFEQYLPYAIALNVETKWSKALDEALRYTQHGQDSYTPSWYTGVWTKGNFSFLRDFS